MEIQSITLSRGERTVFQDFSLRLTEQRIGLIGANGSGKSTLFRLLKGLLKPASGQVVVNGPVGLVFQNPEHQLLFPTVREELCFGLTEQGLTPELAAHRAAQLLAEYGMTALMNKAVHELSDGQKQLVCIFSVVLDGADILLLDEPCASLDLATTQGVMSLVEGLPQQVILATHDLRLIKNYDRVIWLENGCIQQDGPAEAVMSAYEAAQLSSSKEALW